MQDFFYSIMTCNLNEKIFSKKSMTLVVAQNRIIIKNFLLLISLMG